MSGKPMAHYPNLWRRNGVYYLRKRVPVDLTPVLGKTHVVVSLKTRDKRTAEGRYGIELGKLERRFEERRTQRDQTDRVGEHLAAGRLDKLADRDVEALAHDWFRGSIQPPPAAPDGQEWRELIADLKATVAELTSPDPARHRDYVENVADQILIRAGARAVRSDGKPIQPVTRVPAVDKASPKYAQLCRLLRRALIVGNRRDLLELTGKPIPDDDPLFSLASDRPLPRTRGKTLDGLIKAFENDPGRAGKSTKTTLEYSMVFRALREVIGPDRDVRDITRDDCRQVRDLFVALPPNATKRFPKLTLRQAAKRAADKALPRLNAKSVNNYINKVATLFNWAVREEFIDRNPAKGLGVENPNGAGRREPFTLDQLRAIFSAPLYTGCMDDEHGYAKPGPNRPRRARFWIPLLSLFHGLRLNEACQLRADDVAERDGVPVLLIRAADADQKVKTRAGHRIVPLHPEIGRLGFLKFVEDARKAGRQRLFPELKQDARGYYSDGFQKWFSRFLDGCGVEGRSFHCFRHTWADRLRDAGVPEDRRNALGGWADSGIGARYGKGFPMRMLAADIACVSYPGLNLDLG